MRLFGRNKLEKPMSDFLNEMASIIKGLPEFAKKYAHLKPKNPLPKNKDGLMDTDNLEAYYRREILGLKEAVYASTEIARIPSMLADIRRSIKRDNRRLSKEDFIKIREEIEKELNIIEPLCNTDYDYKKAIEEIQNKTNSEIPTDKLIKSVEELENFIKKH